MIPALAKSGNYPYDIEKELRDIQIYDDPDDIDDLLEQLDDLKSRGIAVSVDTEADDIDPAQESPAGKGIVVTIQFSWIEEVDEYDELEDLVEAILDREVEPVRVWIDCRNPRMLQVLRPWLEDPKAPKVLHNWAFDQHEVWNHGIIMRGIVGDTLQMSREQFPERMSHSLDGEVGLVRTILRDRRPTTKQALGIPKKKKDGSDGKDTYFPGMLFLVDDEGLRKYQQVYSTFDVYDTIRLYYVLMLWMREMEWMADGEPHEDGLMGCWESHSIKLLEVLIHMERQGICVDPESVDWLIDAYQKDIDELLDEIYGTLGIPINLNSPPQKAWALFGRGEREFKRAKKDGGPFVIEGLGLPCKEEEEEGKNPWAEKTNKAGRVSQGNPSTDKEHLEWTLGRVDPESVEAELLQLLRRHSELDKLVSSTLIPLKRNLRERHKTGVREPGEYLYIHGNFSPSTRTGRLASSNANLQNVPSRTYLGKRIRQAFTCEDDESLLVADYSQLELNILSWYLAEITQGDTSYAQLLRDGDIHTSTAEALGIKRYAAKAVNFGVLYGMTEYKLAVQLGISVDEARGILYDFYRVYPYIEQYGEWAVDYARETGSARTMLGRYRQLPHIAEQYTSGRRRGQYTWKAKADERRAKNTPIQGSAQDVVALAMIALFNDEELKDYGYVMRGQVHDEMIGTCKAKFRTQALERKIYLMENAVVFPEYDGVVRFPVEGFAGLTWGEGKSGSPFTCLECDGRGKIKGKDCSVCDGEGEFSVKKAGELWTPT